MGRHCLFCISLGLPFFGYRTVSKRILLIDLETPSRDELQLLLSTYITGHKITVPPQRFFIEHTFSVALDTDHGLDWLIKRIKSCNPEVVAIDPLYKALSQVGKLQIERAMKNIDHIRQMFPRISFIIFHHTRKERVDPAGNLIDGGLDELLDNALLSAWVDTAIRVRRTTEQGLGLSMAFTALRSATRELPQMQLKFDPVTLGFS